MNLSENQNHREKRMQRYFKENEISNVSRRLRKPLRRKKVGTKNVRNFMIYRIIQYIFEICIQCISEQKAEICVCMERHFLGGSFETRSKCFLSFIFKITASFKYLFIIEYHYFDKLRYSLIRN